MCPLIVERHIYTFYISFICRLIINAHINVTHHAEITLVYMCRLMLNGRDIYTRIIF